MALMSVHGQAGGGSFLLQPRRYALSSRWLWTLNHNIYENRLEEVQRAATSSLVPPTLFRDAWPSVQLLCAQHNTPCQWELAIDKAKPPTSAAEWQDNDQTGLKCQAARLVTIRSNELLAQLGIEDLNLILKLRWYGYMERSNGEVVSLWHTGWWKAWIGRPKMTWKQLTERDCRKWKLSAIDPHDSHIWRSDFRYAMHTASRLHWRGALIWMLPLYLHVNLKSDDDDDENATMSVHSGQEHRKPELPHFSRETPKGLVANSADRDQTPQNYLH